MTKTAEVAKLCESEFESLKGRFRGDDVLLKQAILTMCEEGYHHPEEEIPELSEDAELLINKWRGDSRSSGLEMALVAVWNRARRLRSA